MRSLRCWLGLSQSTIVLLIALLWFRIPLAGSFLTLYIGIIVFLWAVVGTGLLLSSFIATIQQALLVCFLITLPLILLSGLFTPLSSMPLILQNFGAINPAHYMIDISRRVYLEGGWFEPIVIGLDTPRAHGRSHAFAWCMGARSPAGMKGVPTLCQRLFAVPLVDQYATVV